MIKSKLKNIDNLTQELKNKFNNETKSDYKIGVVVFTDKFNQNSYSLFLGNVVKEQVIKNGYEAEIIVLPSLNERFRLFNNNNYVLNAYKNQIVNTLELTLFDKNIDGVVLVGNGLNCTLGGILSSIRLNIPTLVLPIGLTKPTQNKTLLDTLSLPGQIANNQKSVYDYNENCFDEVVGSGSTFSSENILNVCFEIMELTLKNSSNTFAFTFEKLEEAKQVANKIVLLTKNRLPLKKMINKKSIENALKLNFCLGGNPSVITALKDICLEAELELDSSKILSLSKNVPVLFDEYKGFNEFINFGGVWALIKAMIKEKIIDGNYKTFADTTLLDETKSIKDFSNFTKIKNESLVILKGNLAEKFCVVKTINLDDTKSKIIGKALVFESDFDASNAIINKIIDEESIIIIKNCGKDTQTGLSTVAQTAITLKSMNLNNIILTDGLICEDINILGISLICPDSKDGNIKILKDGDEIEIDFAKGKINVDLGSREILLRHKKYLNEHKILPKYLK